MQRLHKIHKEKVGNGMGMEVLEGLRVSQSQQQPTMQEKQQRDPFPSRYFIMDVSELKLRMAGE